MKNEPIILWFRKIWLGLSKNLTRTICIWWSPGFFSSLLGVDAGICGGAEAFSSVPGGWLSGMGWTVDMTT